MKASTNLQDYAILYKYSSLFTDFSIFLDIGIFTIPFTILHSTLWTFSQKSTFPP